MFGNIFLASFIFCFLKIQLCYSSFDKEYPGLQICRSVDIQSFNEHNIGTRMKDVTDIIAANCTYIQGSLYIKNLRGLKNQSIWLDSIKEIDGHLVIDNSDMSTISLSNLVIIRGNSPLKLNATHSLSLQVSNNPNLKVLNLQKLRSVMNHGVLFSKNPELSYLPHKIKWNELFNDQSKQRLYSSAIPPDISLRDSCSTKCSVWTNQSTSFCWGPADNHCQQRTKCDLGNTDCEECFYKNGKDIGCCDNGCTGGCHGFGPERCVSCKSYLDGKKCVDVCPSPHLGGPDGTKPNKDFKYQYFSLCSKNCPAYMIPEEYTCVSECSTGYFKNNSRCVKCYGNFCDNENLPCNLKKMGHAVDGNFILTKEILTKLTKCKKIVGYIIINVHTFKKYNVTEQMLHDHLSNVEEIEGGFSYFSDGHLSNLTFLQKLKVFQVAKLHSFNQNVPSFNSFSISNTQLKFLGLKSLKKLVGSLNIGVNKKLCYMDLPWKEIVTGVSKITPTKCPDEKCSSECFNNRCWMDGNKWCFSCKNFEAEGQCISNCSSIKGYYFAGGGSSLVGPCSKCHKECSHTCNGPLSKDCIGGCVHKEENGVCVTNCSLVHYAEKGTNKCLPCNPACTVVPNSPMCSGPSDVPGVGGCNKCNLILIKRSGGSASTEEIVKCVQNMCPERTYPKASTNKDISKYFHHIGYLCEPCHPLCSNCTGRGHFKSECTTCQGSWNSNTCSKFCPSDQTYGFKTVNSSRVCLRCHSTCATGCRGPTKWDCKKCKDRRINVNDTSFYCQKKCPEDKMHEEMHATTHEVLCFNELTSPKKIEERKRTNIVILCVVIMIIIVVVSIVIVVVCLRKKATIERLKADLNARYSNLTEPNSKDESALLHPPNMGRLVIISAENLIFEDQARPLGSGSFGYVYKGKWKIPKKDNVIIRKSAGDFFLPVAIKVIKDIGSSDNEAIMQEAKIMASVSHMHCLRFIGICLSNEKPCLITAYVKEGSLDKYLVRSRHKISSLNMLNWAEQIADGMVYLSKRGIIHRDLAARNVLVSRLECVQITDFGLSKMLESSKEKEVIIKKGKVPIRWLAIETLLEGRYSSETDVWAYGVTLWEIFTFGKVPYEDQATHDICDFVMKGGRLSQPEICSLDVYIVMVNCWLESPNLRPNFESLMMNFMDYCKNPGRYLSIQGDPFEIPSPANIEMHNFNNHYGDHFNFQMETSDPTNPLIKDRDVIDEGPTDVNFAKKFPLHDEDEHGNLLPPSDSDDLPTRAENRSSNIFKRLADRSQPGTLSTQRTVPSVSLDEPLVRGSSVDEDPRYVPDPTEIKLRSNTPNIKTPLLITPRAQSTPYGNLPPPPKTPHVSVDTDGYLEPIRSPALSSQSAASSDADGYLEPVSMKKKVSVDQDDYLTPTYSNSPRESLLKTGTPASGRAFSKLSSMNEERSPSNLYFPQNLVDDEYLEPTPKSSLLKS